MRGETHSLAADIDTRLCTRKMETDVMPTRQLIFIVRRLNTGTRQVHHQVPTNLILLVTI